MFYCPVGYPPPSIYPAVRPSSSSRRTLPIKRADAEPLSRQDIQYDLLDAIFSDKHAVFTGHPVGDNPIHNISRNLTFCELYSFAVISSPRCSKMLREKMMEIPEFAVDFAKISLLANVGRINTTMAFFPEMKTILRSYHPVPSLQRTQENLQDAPRIKNCLKACLLTSEVHKHPSTIAAVVAKREAGVVPTTSVVNLLFVLSGQTTTVSKQHFDPSFEFLDIFLPLNVSSASRARAFLWLVFHYLESPTADNPFADDYARRHPGKIPRLTILTPRQFALENVDTEKELAYGRKMAMYRSRFLKKQIAAEEKARASLRDEANVKANSRVSPAPEVPPPQQHYDMDQVVYEAPLPQQHYNMDQIRYEAPLPQQYYNMDQIRYEAPLPQQHYNMDQIRYEAPQAVGSTSRADGGCRYEPPQRDSVKVKYPKIAPAQPKDSDTRHYYHQRQQSGISVPPDGHSMVQHAWRTALSRDALVGSDEEVCDERARIDYERRLHILNTKVRQKELTPEPEYRTMARMANGTRYR